MRRFLIGEVERDGKISISIVADEVMHFVSTMEGSGVVTVERTGDPAKTYSLTGNIHEISSELCREFIIDGLLEADQFELNYAKIPIPSTLLKIKKIIKVTEIGTVEGLGRMEQLKNVKKELIAVGTDITDEELKDLNDYGTLVLNSDHITENGVMDKFEKWLELPVTSGNHFEIRYIPSSPEFTKTQIFKNLARAELKWTQYFAFDMKYTQKSGKVEEFTGFYFVHNEYHLIKVLISTDFKPRIVKRK
ncbi:hypothetical protein CAEBREN_17249 [Caenorhabditis brenneri]|uniref:Uncharacterized protein n=1 Tax=Caenorhabditis brenneri TaxID=135651 RepID=G0NMJ6_CAEBE|nr:hypothetical protein CAEBREN_17249 [Caenorhabditis brenneri]